MSQGSWYYNPSWENNYPGIQIIPPAVSHQPTIIQQLAAPVAPLSYPIRPSNAKEDLIELMMIQNAQMHQVIMSNMTMSAMSNFGYGPTQSTPTPSVIPVHIEEEEPLVYHHHYEPYPVSYPSYPMYPTWPPQVPMMSNPEPTVRHLNLDTLPVSPGHSRDQRAVPPPPPLSATGTVGADVPPASEYYDMTDVRL
ncbi:proline-rich protein 29-like isoform 2-T5 [Discoglossus pictus]